MIYSIGIIIAFFLVAILLTKKNKSKADIILAIWLIVIGIHLFLFYLHSNKLYIEIPYFLGLELPLPFAHAPFLFLYTAALTNQENHKKYTLLHFLPILLTYLYFLPFLTSSVVYKIEVYNQKGILYRTPMKVLFFIFSFVSIFYLSFTLSLLRKHKLNIENQFSYSENINLNWLRLLIYGLSIIWLVIILGVSDQVIFTMVVVYVLLIGYFGIKQVGIFTQSNQLIPITLANIETATAKPQTVKYQKSGLSIEQIDSIHLELKQLMTEVKLYKNAELTLSEVANHLDIHPNYLSQVINTKEGKNFFDYINTLRVAEFINVVNLPQNRKFTLIALAFECGFNSKTSFNRNFKKVTELSPTAYLNQQHIDLKPE